MQTVSSVRHRSVLKQLWFWVVVAIGAGGVFGFVAPDMAKEAKWLADAFLQLVKTITAPVIFLTVVIGIASLGDMAKAGGLAVRALGYFFCATLVALGLGLLAANLIKPGDGFAGGPPAGASDAAKEKIAEAGDAGHGLVGFITNDLLPTSFVQPFVENEVLKVLVLAILVAAALTALAPGVRARVLGGFEVASQIVFGVIRLIMWTAPLGAFGGMAFTVAQFGGGALENLAMLLVTFWGTAAVFVFVVLGLVARLSGFSIIKFIRLLKDELLIILGTSSSETVLPRLLVKLERAGASRRSVGVVLPTGYSFNLDGTCIYLTLGALFIVQASGQDMAIGEQLALAGLMVLTSKGAAGITGAGLVTLTASLQAFGGTFFSPESIAIGIALVVGIDRVMSEGRALTNCIGNGVATMVIARWQGELDEERFHAALDNPSLADPELGPIVSTPDVPESVAQPRPVGRTAEPVPALS
ncbi:MAG: aerobic C4-dicarboxylate transport protein [Thermoleophilaceae bacterium]|nr:aerobic C4-dicarboxylate transport protein [Thermoleophilaceae bacterium]